MSLHIWYFSLKSPIYLRIFISNKGKSQAKAKHFEFLTIIVLSIIYLLAFYSIADTDCSLDLLKKNILASSILSSPSHFSANEEATRFQ